MVLNKDRRYKADQIVGTTYILYCTRIPMSALAFHREPGAATVGVWLFLSCCILPLVFSYRIGAWVQVVLQSQVLILSLKNLPEMGHPQIVALLVDVYCAARLGGLIGPCLISMSAKTHK